MVAVQYFSGKKMHGEYGESLFLTRALSDNQKSCNRSISCFEASAGGAQYVLHNPPF